MTDKTEKKPKKLKVFGLILLLLVVFSALTRCSFVPYEFHTTYVNISMPQGTPGFVRGIAYTRGVLSDLYVRALLGHMNLYEKMFLDVKPYKEPFIPGVLVINPQNHQIWQNKEAVYHDWEGDGFAEASAWPGAGERVLMNEVEPGKKWTPLSLDANTGLQGLSALNSNDDTVLDAKDPEFLKLKIWTIGKIDEKMPQDVVAFHDVYEALDISNGMAIAKSPSETRDQIALVQLKTQKVNSKYINDFTLDAAVLFLPTLRGYGLLPDLHIAMSQDKDLKEMVMEFSKCDLLDAFANPAQTQIQAENILLRWAKADAIEPLSRGPYIDARKLHYLEKMMARDFYQKKKWYNPRPYAAKSLEGSWNTAYQQQISRLIFQTCGRSLFKSSNGYNPVTDYMDVRGGLNQQAIAGLLLKSKSLPPEQKGAVEESLRYFLDAVQKQISFRDKMFLSNSF